MYKQTLTLFRAPEHYSSFRILVNTALENPGLAGLSTSADNLYPVADLISYVQRAMPHLAYCDIEHVTELYLKAGREEHYSFQFESGSFGFSYGKKSAPPVKLYFGTLTHLRERINMSGISKKTICLTESRETALAQAIQYLKFPNDKPAVFEVDALKAFEDGVCSFSSSEGSGEWFSGPLIPRVYVDECN